MTVSHTFEAVAVVTGNYGPGPAELIAGKSLHSLTFVPESWKPGSFSSEWSKVGTARITVELVSVDEMVGNKVTSLQAELAADMAESERRQGGIREKIQNLLAITHEVAA